MFTSDEISQRTSSGFSYGFGPMGSPQWKADAGFSGLTPFGPGASDAFVGGSFSAASSIANTVSLGSMGAAAAGWGLNKMGITPPGILTKFAKMGGFGMSPAAGTLIGTIPMVIGSAAGAVTNQLQTNNIVMQSLGNRMGMGGPGGIGPSRSNLQYIGDATRELAQIPALMSEVEDLNAVMTRLTQAGMMQGAKNIADFKNKFMQSIGMLREMSMVLGSTLEEASGVAAELHKMGIVNSRDKLRLATGIQVSSMMGTGMSSELVAQTVGAGLQMAQAMGGKSRVAASQGTLQTLQSLSVANQMGLINEQKVADITGFTGEQGLASLAALTQQRVSSMMMDSGLGQAMTAAMSETKDGKFTGKLDSALVQKFKSGAISKEELMRLGSQKLSGAGAGASFVRQRGTLSFNAAQAVGFEGVLNQIASMMDEVGEGNEDLVAIVAKNFLAGDQGLADVLLPMARQMKDVSLKSKDEFRRGLEARMSAAIYKRDNTISGKFAKISHFVSSLAGSYIGTPATTLAAGVSEGMDSMSRFITGAAETVTVSDYNMRAAQMGFGTGRNSATLTEQQINVSSGRALSSLPPEIRAKIEEKFKDPAERARISAEFSQLQTQQEQDDYLMKELGLYGMSGGKMAVAAIGGALALGTAALFAPVGIAAAIGTGAAGGLLIGGGFGIGQSIKTYFNENDLNVNTEEDKAQLRVAMAEYFASGDKENALAGYKTGLNYQVLSNEQRDSLAEDLQEAVGDFTGMDVENFVKTGSRASELFLQVLQDGKFPDGTTIEQFVSKSNKYKREIIKRQPGLRGLSDAEINAITDELVPKLSHSKIMSGENKEDAAKYARGLLEDRAAQANLMIEEQFKNLAMQVGGETDLGKAILGFAQGSNSIIDMLKADGALAEPQIMTPALKNARTAIQNIGKNSKKVGVGGKEEDLLKELNLDINIPNVARLVSDEDTTLSESERSGLISLAERFAVASNIAPSTSTEGLRGEQRAAVKDESTLLMIRANIDFVNAVASAVGNHNLSLAANKISLAAAYDQNVPTQ